MSEFSWKLGGAQGEGIDSSGEIFALTLHRLGYYVSTFRHFASLIKGGHTNYKVRITTRQRRHRGDTLNLLVALDQTTIDENAAELTADGAILYDEGVFEPKLPEGCTAELIGVPFTQIAKDLGLVIMKNMVALGASAALLGLPYDLFEQFIAERYGRRGAAVVESNRKALAHGFEAARRRRRGAASCPSWSRPRRARSGCSCTATMRSRWARSSPAAASSPPTRSPRRPRFCTARCA